MICVIFSHTVLMMAHSYVANPYYIETVRTLTQDFIMTLTTFCGLLYNFFLMFLIVIPTLFIETLTLLFEVEVLGPGSPEASSYLENCQKSWRLA